MTATRRRCRRTRAAYRRFGYMDAINFAARINPDALVAITTGGYDGVCPPTGVFAAYWRCPAKTNRMAFAPLGGHCQGDYLEGRNQVPAEWNGTARIDASGFDPAEAELFLDGEQAGSALKAKKYRHQKNGVRTVVVDGCPAGRHELKIFPKSPWAWANLGLEEIVVVQ